MTTFNIKGGLRSPELLLLQRALSSYIGAYTAIKAERVIAERGAIGKQGVLEAQQYIDAAVALGERLRLETVPHE